MDVRAQNELSVIPGLRALKNVLTPLRTAKLCQCSSMKTNAKLGLATHVPINVKINPIVHARKVPTGKVVSSVCEERI